MDPVSVALFTKGKADDYGWAFKNLTPEAWTLAQAAYGAVAEESRQQKCFIVRDTGNAIVGVTRLESGRRDRAHRPIKNTLLLSLGGDDAPLAMRLVSEALRGEFDFVAELARAAFDELDEEADSLDTTEITRRLEEHDAELQGREPDGDAASDRPALSSASLDTETSATAVASDLDARSRDPASIPDRFAVLCGGVRRQDDVRKRFGAREYPVMVLTSAPAPERQEAEAVPDEEKKVASKGRGAGEAKRVPLRVKVGAGALGAIALLLLLSLGGGPELSRDPMMAVVAEGRLQFDPGGELDVFPPVALDVRMELPGDAADATSKGVPVKAELAIPGWPKLLRVEGFARMELSPEARKSVERIHAQCVLLATPDGEAWTILWALAADLPEAWRADVALRELRLGLTGDARKALPVGKGEVVFLAAEAAAYAAEVRDGDTVRELVVTQTTGRQ